MLRHSNSTARHNGPLMALLVIGVLLFAAAQEAAAACRGAWAEGNTYQAGDVVSYNGSNYTATQTHTACVGCGWNPQAAPSLWSAGGTCTTPTPTPTVRPTATPRPTATVRPTATPTPTPTTTTCYPAWSSTTVYTGGQRVTRSGVNYEAKWWTQGNDPATNSCTDCVWRNIGNCGTTTPTVRPTPTPTTRPTATPTQTPPRSRSAIYGGGPFYTGGTTVMNTLRSSGFTTVILWTIHVRSNGDLVFNDHLVASNGAYVGNSAWPSQLATLKQAPTLVNRIEIAVGSWGVPDFETIRNLITSQGTGTNSILYRNFLALKNATRADAVNFDDESLYDVNTAVRFGVMLADMGFKISYAPYTNQNFWTSARTQTLSQRPGSVDRIYLQVYAGGAGNNPASWNTAFGGFKVDPGVWSKHGSGCAEGDSPSQVQSKMAGWKSSAGITGGFMWLYDDMQACASQGTPAQYAGAINNALAGP